MPPCLPLQPEEALDALEAAGFAVQLSDDGLIAYLPSRPVRRPEVGHALGCSEEALAQCGSGVAIAFGRLREGSTVPGKNQAARE